MNYLSPKKVAVILNCSRRQASRLMNNGTLPAVKVGGLIRVSETALERYLMRLERKSGNHNESSMSRMSTSNGSNSDTPALVASNNEDVS
jgi:excisionase family DNA binding protein